MGWSEAETAGSIPGRFEHQVKLRPDRPAIAGTSAPLTYGELDALADRYARALRNVRESGRGAGERAALLLGHDGRLVAAVLGALKCGMAVATLNPGDPPARLGQIRAEVEPHVIVTDQPQLDLSRDAGFEDARTVVISEVAAAGPDSEYGSKRQSGPDSDVASDSGEGPGPQPDDLAFLISTSGSSGRPKVVMQSHRNVLHNVLRYTNGLQIDPEDRVALMTSLSGGQGLATTWTTLLNGATLCPFPIAERGVTGLAGWLAENRVTVFDTIPSVFRSFVQTLKDERIAGVRLVRVASEGALESDFQEFRRHFAGDCMMASVLASSETGIMAQAILHADDQLAGGRLPVGRPAEGIEVLLVAEDGRLIADGEVGQIVVQGRYLSPGYWRDEALTAKRFEAAHGSRRFYTGDLAIRSPDGVLTVMGRADKQVKIRGHRLQLEEVEAAIAGHPDVGQVAVTLRSTERGDSRLTAYMTPAPGRTLVAAEVRRWLRHLLAPHAIPAAFMIVAALPVNAHGKLDPERLADLDPADVTTPTGRPPASETEELLAGLWADAFERAEIDRHEAFLELGGDSLLAAQIAAGIHDILGVDLDLGVFAADPTVATLAALVDQRRQTGGEDELPALRKTERTGPLSYAQARFWPALGVQSDPRWHVVVPFAIRGALDVEVLRKSVEQIVRRHEILRTTFSDYDGRPFAIVRAPEPLPLPLDDLRAVPDQQARIEEVAESELLRPYDLERGPLFRLRLLRLADEHYELLRMSHHLLNDATSWRIFFDELALIYEALIDDRPSPLTGEPPLQYIDYTVWERARVKAPSRRFETEVAWWQNRLQSPPTLLKLPFTRPEPQPDAPLSKAIFWGLPAEHADRLDRLGRASGATFYMTRLAVFTALLAIETGGPDFLIGSPVSTRTRFELQGMFGPLINFTQLRFRFPGEPNFRDWLAEVRRVVIDTGAHTSIPWEVLSSELLDRGGKLRRVSAMFIPSGSVESMRFGGIELDPLPRPCPQVAPPLFRIGLNRPYETDRCWADFDSRIHDPAGVESFLSRLQALAAAVGAEPDRSLVDLHALAGMRGARE